MRRLCLVVLLAATAASAQDAPDLQSLFALTGEQPGDGPLSVLLRLRDAEATYASDPQLAGLHAQLLTQRLALLGDHAGALRWGDRQSAGQRWDSVGTLPSGTQALDAVSLIAERARAERVVMVNEAHNDAASRILTLRLLPVLYAQGYRYFAAESFKPDVAETTRGGYPRPETGYYVGEPVFGAIVREALRLGYTLVPYEIERDDPENADTTRSRQENRDAAQARHLAERTVERDPEARVLVHAGYGHIYEPTDDLRTMAGYFRAFTGTDPLTVDQTTLSEHGDPAFEHPRYRAADAAGLLGGAAVVLADADGVPLAPTYNPNVDLQVLTPRTPLVSGRPAWPGRDDLRLETSLTLPEACAATGCLVESILTNEERAGVPLDRVVVDDGRLDAILVPSGSTPADSWIVRVRDGRTGEELGMAAGLDFLLIPTSP